MRALILRWVAAFLILLAASVGAVVLANATIFGAGSFVRIYLDAVARGDARSALGLPGVDAGDDSELLLVSEALAGLDRLQQVADVDLGDGEHRVTYSWRSPEGTGETDFVVERVGTRFGLFPVWGFATSPMATVQLAVQHDAAFRVNGLETSTGRDDGATADYAVLVPGGYVFDRDDTFLAAEPVTILADTVGAQTPATVDVQATPRLVDDVQQKVDDYLDECATQTVLFPTGCPFGQAIDNRVVSAPAWTIVEYPLITVVPGDEFETWSVPTTSGVAHLTVEVQSLFDGSRSTFDQDVDFAVGYLIRFADETTVTIEPTT